MIVHICDICDVNRTEDVCKLCEKDVCSGCANKCGICLYVFCSVCLEDREDFFKNCEKCGKRACPDNYTGDGFCSKCSFTILSISELNDL